MRTKNFFWLHTAWVLLLAGYILVGTHAVPFHGDESTTIWMSEDFDTLMLNGDFESVYYEDPPRRTTEQHLRIITGNFSKLVMGGAWSSNGLQVEDLNEQWVWSPDLDIVWNRANGHAPSEDLLFYTRLSSALLTALSAVLVFATVRFIGYTLFKSHIATNGAAWLASGFYATNPAVLLNGRRAMFEGGLLFGLSLVAWLIFRIQRKSKMTIVDAILLGIGTGLALTTKHSAAFTITILYAGLLITFVSHVATWQQRGQVLAKVGASTAIALIVMYILSPMWWLNPLAMPTTTIEERQQILDEQVALFGGYESFSERIMGLWDESIAIQPQYAEAEYWFSFDGFSQEVENYESLMTAGIISGNHIVVVVVRLGLILTGIGACVFNIQKFKWNNGAMLLFWAAGMTIITLITVPLPWQRYYLPLQIPLSVLMGVGGAWIYNFLHEKIGAVSR